MNRGLPPFRGRSMTGVEAVMSARLQYWLFAALLAGVLALAAIHAPAGSKRSAFPEPSRPVASIVSPIWHDADKRDAAKEVPQVASLLGIEPGMTVADIGAGSGYYVTRLSPMLGPSGRLIAEDITPLYLSQLEGKVRELRLSNVTVTKGEADDPKLLPHSIDRALLIHVYHEVSQPFGLLYNLAAALKPGAKVGIVDATRSTAEHGTPPVLLRCELSAMGYRETAFHPLSGGDTYLAVFELPPDGKPTPPDRVKPCKEE